MQLLKYGAIHGVLTGAITALRDDIANVRDQLQADLAQGEANLKMLEERLAQFVETHEHLMSITDPDTIPVKPETPPMAQNSAGDGAQEADNASGAAQSAA